MGSLLRKGVMDKSVLFGTCFITSVSAEVYRAGLGFDKGGWREKVWYESGWLAWTLFAAVLLLLIFIISRICWDSKGEDIFETRQKIRELRLKRRGKKLMKIDTDLIKPFQYQVIH